MGISEIKNPPEAQPVEEFRSLEKLGLQCKNSKMPRKLMGHQRILRKLNWRNQRLLSKMKRMANRLVIRKLLRLSKNIYLTHPVIQQSRLKRTLKKQLKISTIVKCQIRLENQQLLLNHIVTAWKKPMKNPKRPKNHCLQNHG